MGVAELPRYRFTIDDFYRMGRAGIFADAERAELIEGEIVPMSPIGEAHAACVDALVELFVTPLHGQAQIRAQNPVNLGPWSAFQPDVAVLRPRQDRYRMAHPGAEDILLVVEVSDTTLERDRLQLAVYATAGVREVWTVDLPAHTIHVRRAQESGQYREVFTVSPGQTLALEAFPDIRFAVNEILS